MLTETDIARTGDWTQTFSGVPFYANEAKPEDFKIQDIAHALSNLCRFAGHTNEFYSVAQHSVLVSYLVPAEDALWGLLHDAPEAYICDLPRPVKYMPEMQAYIDLDKKLMRSIAIKFRLPAEQPLSVKVADNIVLLTEKRDLLKICTQEWNCGPDLEPMEEKIIPLLPKEAKLLFLKRFAELYSHV